MFFEETLKWLSPAKHCLLIGTTMLPSGKRLQKTMENHHAINGKTHYKWDLNGIYNQLDITPGELGGWGWGHPKCSGPGNFLYNVSQLNLQNGLPGNFSTM